MTEDFIFLSDCPGFHARIKAIPEHFMVNEISNFSGNGNQEETKCEKLQGLKRKGDDMISHSPKRQSKEMSSENPVEDHIYRENSGKSDAKMESGRIECDQEWCKAKLHELLPQAAQSELEKLASETMIAESQTLLDKSQCESAKKIVPVSLILGSFVSKDERTLLHRCVRYTFPQLKTITAPNTPVVSAHICPNYFKFSEVIGHTLARDLLRFILVESAEHLRDAITITGDFTKEKRRQLHHLIASCYGKFMETKTCPPSADGLSRITIRPKKRPWRGNDGDISGILAFTLWKKNTETYTAIQQLASHLHLQPHMLNFAGIKDKRAVTTQRCTVGGISQNKLQILGQSLPKHLRISDIYPVSRVIHLGELKGNHFDIRLTDVKLEDADVREQFGNSLRNVVDSAMRAVKDTGFVNYFGPQRFGRQTFSSLNSSADGLTPLIEGPAVGLAMLLGDFEKAVKILLNPAENLPSDQINDVVKAKLYYQTTGDIEGTLKMMPQHKMREISLLKTLHRCGKTDRYAFTKALLSLPHNSRLLYVHSFCSWIWNKMASERLRIYGANPVVGDLAAPKEEKESAENTESTTAIKEKIFVVTEDDIISGRVGPEDIVLTVPGNQVRYPPILAGEYERSLRVLKTRESEEISFRIPDLKLNAPGTYRRLIAFPRNLTWRFVPPFKSTSRVQQCVPRQNEGEGMEKATKDVDALPPLSSSSASLESKYALDATSRPSSSCCDCAGAEESVQCDVELEFDLRPSCYATTFLQEVTNGHLR